MSTSIIYRSAHGYELVMRALYGAHYAARMRAIADQVPFGASVLELCCGPGTLYRRYLSARAGTYVGIDVNARFVSDLRRRGIDVRLLDLRRAEQPLPEADVVLIQASLYHFLPEAGQLIDQMMIAARDRVIVSEPVRNLASSRMRIIRAVGRLAADPGVGGHAQRFSEQALDQLMDPYRERLLGQFTIPGGREKVYVLAARAGLPAPPSRPVGPGLLTPAARPGAGPPR